MREVVSLLYSRSNPDAQFDFDGFPSWFIGRSNKKTDGEMTLAQKRIAIKHLQERKDTINMKNESTTLGARPSEAGEERDTAHINISHYFKITYKTHICAEIEAGLLITAHGEGFRTAAAPPRAVPQQTHRQNPRSNRQRFLRHS